MKNNQLKQKNKQNRIK